MKFMALTIFTIMSSLSVYAQANRSNAGHPFEGQWCATAENEHQIGYKIVFNSDNTMVSFGDGKRIDWVSIYNPGSEMIAGAMAYVTEGKTTREHSEKDDGISVLFYISPEGRLIWAGPVLDHTFNSITPQNLEKHLLMDARKYRMTFERCEYLGS